MKGASVDIVVERPGMGSSTVIPNNTVGVVVVVVVKVEGDGELSLCVVKTVLV